MRSLVVKERLWGKRGGCPFTQPPDEFTLSFQTHMHGFLPGGGVQNQNDEESLVSEGSHCRPAPYCNAV